MYINKIIFKNEFQLSIQYLLFTYPINSIFIIIIIIIN